MRPSPSLRAAVVVFSLLAGVAGARASVPLPVTTGYTLYVSNERSDNVSVIDATTRTVTATIPVGKRPRGIHVSPDGRDLYVAVSGSPRLGPGADPERARSAKADKAADGIAIVDLASSRVLRKLNVGSDPEQFALSRDGTRLFVANEDEGAASCWEIGSGRKIFRSTVSDEPEGVGLHPTRNEVYFTCEEQGDVFILAATDGREIARVSVGGRPRSVAFLPDGSRAYVPLEGKAAIAVLDTTSHRLSETISVPGQNALPMAAVMTSDGRQLFVSTGRGNTVAVVDTAANKVVAIIPVGGRPWGLALSPDERTLFAANGATNDVSIVDVAARKEIGRIKTGDGPWGIAIRPSASRANAH